MPIVVIYSTLMCPYCVRAKHLLQRKGVDYQEIRVDLDEKQMRLMMQLSQRRTVPQIYIGEHHVGGFDDLSALDRQGGLDPLLAA